MSRVRSAVRAIVATLARPVGLVEYFFRRNDESGDIYPSDAGSGTVDGANPERVIVIGEGTARGLGTTTHQLGVAGHFSRQFATRFSRGVEWSTIGLPDNRLRSVPAAVTDQCVFERTDLVILMIGITDTLRLTPPRLWEPQLRAAIDAISTKLPRDGRILIALIPPMDNAASISRAARLAGGQHSRRLNRVTRVIARSHANCTAVEFPSDLQRELWKPESQESSYARMYVVWAKGLLAALPETTATMPVTLAAKSS